MVTVNCFYQRKKCLLCDKKSHILLARYLADQMPANESLQSHRKAFCLGNILSDIQPSFVTKRHEYFGTFDEVQGKIRRLVQSGAGYNDRVFWRRSGEVMHYIADYFTFPHNKTFDGTLYQHNTYEKHLKNELKAFVLEGKADVYTEKEIHFETLNQLLQYIKEHHRRYLNCKRNIDDDIHYISLCAIRYFRDCFSYAGRMDIADYAYAVM